MTPDELEEMIALDSVGALEDAEQRLLEEALRADPAGRQRALEMRETAACLAYTGPPVQPPPELKRRIMEAVSQRVASETPATATLFGNNWLPWSVAAVFIILASITALRDVYGPRPAGDRHLRVAHLHPAAADSATVAEIVWDTVAERGSLDVRHMPAPPQGCCYQIWIIAPGKEEPVSGGTFVVAADGSADVAVQPAEPVSGAEHFLVSVEAAGGVKKARGPMVLAGS